MKDSYVYIMTNKKRGTLYTGVTSDLVKRSYEHKNKLIKGFTSRYGLDKLVYYKIFGDITYAIEYEKQLKNWHRDWKINLIEQDNPHWDDLYYQICS
jgi:putative endonuclease